ncbi:MAG TPA: hypothetical protein VIE68_10060 [Gemmatimonadota bacterium]
MTPATNRTERPSTLSRNVAFASAVVIAALVAYLTIQAFGDGSPARITIEVVSSETWIDGSIAYVPVDVRNTGGATAADVEVETSFEVQGADPIVKRTSFDFLAGGERRRFYAAGPRGAALAARVIGFQEP